MGRARAQPAASAAGSSRRRRLVSPTHRTSAPATPSAEYLDGQPSNGFVFQGGQISGLIDALERAAALWWHDRSGWEWRMRTAMEARHGWGPSAAEYLSLY